MAGQDEETKPERSDEPAGASQPAQLLSKPALIGLSVALMIVLAVWSATRRSAPPQGPHGNTMLTPPPPGRSDGTPGLDGAAPMPSNSGAGGADDVPPPSQQPSFRAAGTAELQLLAPLRDGASFSGGQIVRITGVHEGGMHVLIQKAGAEHHFVISLAPSGGQRYAVTAWGSTSPSPVTLELAAALSGALHADASPPPGMRVIDWGAPQR